MSFKQRLTDISKVALPPKGSNEYYKRITELEKNRTPEIDEIASKLFKEAIYNSLAQYENGAGFPIDQELRYFVKNIMVEFGNTAWTHYRHRLT